MSLVLLGILNSQAAGVSAGAYDLLETQVLTSSASSVTFTGLGSYTDYKHLQIRAVGRSNNSGNRFRLTGLRLNGDSGSNYSYHDLYGNGSSVISSSNTGSSNIPVLAINGSASTSNAFGVAVIDLLDFSSSSKNTTIKSLTGFHDAAQPIYRVMLRSGVWLNTAAVTSITMGDLLGGYDWAVGSRFSLYGVK